MHNIQQNKIALNALTYFLAVLLMANNAYAATVDGRWHIGIGDPTIFGWITVACYFLAVLVCANKAYKLKAAGVGYRFWLCLALFLLLLGINKQLDLQTWFTQTLRDSARAQGWYESRRPLQALFIFSLAVGILVSLVSIRQFLTASWHRHKVAWIGVELLCTFVLMRAASFHHMDVFINHHWLSVRFNVLLEIGAILVIIVGALREQSPQTAYPKTRLAKT